MSSTRIDPRLYVYESPSGRLRCGPRGNEPLRCEICLSTAPRWTYAVAPMPITGNGPISYSDDEWYICDLCHEIIQTGSVADLAARSTDEQPRNLPAPPGFGYPPRAMRYLAAAVNVRRFYDAILGPPIEDQPIKVPPRPPRRRPPPRRRR